MSMQMAENLEQSASLAEYHNTQAWYGEDLVRRTDWIYEVTAEEQEELRQAVQFAGASGREIHRLELAHFPLKRLARRLAEIRREVLHGRG
ncbi:hypothetical protein QWZ14_29045, partial [Paeniroseomonas aquatica]|nr:hypothetical protein [Paeniroseomonas aquatica]